MTDGDNFDKLIAIMHRSGLDIVALIPGPNLRYVSGVEQIALERPIVLFVAIGQEPVAVVPELEVPLFERHRMRSQLFAYSDAEGYEGSFRAALDAIGARGKTIGLDGSAMRFFEYEVIRRCAPGADLVDASEALVALRLHKSAGEIAAIRRAIAISEGALEAMLAEVRVGMSERELGSILDSQMIRLGGQGVAFETLLHAGGNTALPHTGPLAYRIQHGDPLLVDFGARFAGYCADITRTFFVGAVSAAQRDFYAVVEAANAAGRATAGPGVSAEAVDIATRQVIVEGRLRELAAPPDGAWFGLAGA